MNIKPIGQRLLVEVQKPETKTASGIIIPDSATKKQSQGKVLAIGKELSDDEKNEIQIGNTVLYGEYAGTKIEDGKTEYLLLDIADILAIV